MAIQLGLTMRNAMADLFESTPGVSPILRIYSGAPPADCATAASGTLLSQITLPSDWMNNASAGAKTLLGTWSQASATATGNAGYFRIWNSGDTVCHAQGTVSQSAGSGGSGDIQLQQATTGIVQGQTVTISSFTFTIGGA